MPYLLLLASASSLSSFRPRTSTADFAYSLPFSRVLLRQREESRAREGARGIVSQCSALERLNWHVIPRWTKKIKEQKTRSNPPVVKHRSRSRCRRSGWRGGGGNGGGRGSRDRRSRRPSARRLHQGVHRGIGPAVIQGSFTRQLRAKAPRGGQEPAFDGRGQLSARG